MPEKTKTERHIYAYQPDGSAYTKVGMAKRPEVRVRALGGKSRGRLWYSGRRYECPKDIENGCHWLLSKMFVRGDGEWFLVSLDEAVELLEPTLACTHRTSRQLYGRHFVRGRASEEEEEGGRMRALDRADRREMLRIVLEGGVLTPPAAVPWTEEGRAAQRIENGFDDTHLQFREGAWSRSLTCRQAQGAARHLPTMWQNHLH